MSVTIRPSSLRVATLIAGLWTGVGLVTTQFAYLAILRAGGQASWPAILGNNLASVWLWAAFTPAILWLGTRFPVTSGRWVTNAVVHTAGVVLFAAADVVIEKWVLAQLVPLAAASTDTLLLFFQRLFLNALCYATIVAIATALVYVRIARDRETTSARLAAQLTEARLQSLQAQLRPHFLFNTLSLIAEQVHTDAAGADRMIGRLSALLRASLSTADQQEVPLAHELDILHAYLDIMQVRFADRVTTDIRVPDELLAAMVPAFILQPLAENAFRHGLERRRRAGTLELEARRVNGMLELALADNGRGLDPATVEEGAGLRIVRQRLRELYGDAGTFHLRPRPGGGAVALLRLPYRTLAGSNGSAPHLTMALSR